jgi:CRP/FNR family transcriptional regulator, cyclic AMP receptor protein
MSATAKSLQKGEYLFREGDSSDAAYVMKSGKITITKQKGSSEIELASLGPGQMFGEMAFFDGKSRSAGARAATETVVIVLPFESLNAQFASFPQWLKVMVKTINDNLRDANMRIKNMEQGVNQNPAQFPPYTITKLTSILTMVALRSGIKQPDGSTLLNGTTLRNSTIQIFQEPTIKMQRLLELMQQMGHLKIEDLGDQRTQLQIFSLDFLSEFVEFYNRWLFTEESKRTPVTSSDLKQLKALILFGKDAAPDAKGQTKVNVTQIQNESQQKLGYQVNLNHWGDIIQKKLCSVQMSEAAGIFVTCDMAELKRITPFWEIVYFIEAAEPIKAATAA